MSADVDLDVGLALTLAGDLGTIHSFVVVLARHLKEFHALDVGDDLADDYDGALRFALGLAGAVERGEDLGHAMDVADEYALELAATIARLGGKYKRAVLSQDRSGRADSAAPRHSVLATRMLRQAMRVVPVAHRDRYDEEFLSELHQIAQTHGRWAPVCYALRVVRHVWRLRFALRGVPPDGPERIGAG